MFPTPIQKGPAPVRTAYKIALPIALIIWLAAADRGVITVRFAAPADYLRNYCGLPRDFPSARELFGGVQNSPSAVMVTAIPGERSDRDRASRFVLLTGFALAAFSTDSS